MNVVKCKNGHFFDGDTYSQCPHCGESVDGAKAPQTPVSGKSEKKFFSWGKKEEKPVAAAPERPTESIWNSGRTPTDVLDQPVSAPQVQPAAQPLKSDKTLDFWQTASQPSAVPAEAPVQEEVPAPAPEPVPAPPVQPVAAAEPEPPAKKPEQSQSLLAAVQKASANSAGKTMSYFSAATAGTETASAPQVSTDPVVGWLVCIGGKHFGQSFVIGAGKNSIGRNDDNRIVLSMDHSVSRSKHAFITYEPKKRKFYLQPGDSSGLTYLNDDYIDESKLLQDRDIIELGDSKFLFVPLCGESFTWEDHMRKE